MAALTETNLVVCEKNKLRYIGITRIGWVHINVKSEAIKAVTTKYPIRRLLTVSVDRNELEKQIKTHQNDLDNLEIVCINKYKYQKFGGKS